MPWGQTGNVSSSYRKQSFGVKRYDSNVNASQHSIKIATTTGDKRESIGVPEVFWN